MERNQRERRGCIAMEKMMWTEAQRKVIELRNRNILVSAAAGSGKTAVLVERIISMITDKEHPVDIDQLLVVTFTKAAASQMRDRIGRAIEERLFWQPGNSHLQKQMTLIHSAQITTIHSFCLWVIRNYFNSIDLDPGFRVADEAELILMKSDVMEELLEEKYQAGEEDFLALTECYSTGKTDERIVAMVLNLYQFSISYPWPEEWLKQSGEVFQTAGADQMEKTPWMEALVSYIQFIVAELPDRIEEAKEVCREPEGPMAYLDALLCDGDQLKALVSKRTYQEFYEAFCGFSWEKLKRVSKKDPVDQVLKERVKTIRKEVRDLIDGIRKNFFYQPPDQMAEDILAAAPAMNTLLSLTMEFRERLKARKEENKIVDFNDLEHLALEILVDHKEDGKTQPSAIAKELSEIFEEILIDEYQDSNLVQELLLSSISREWRGGHNRFMVGDVKQSIYKFRLARPELFMEKYHTYQIWEEGDSENQRIDLSNNFRSRKEVLDFSNFVFGQIMQRELGGIAYDKGAALYPGAEYAPCEKKVSTECECLFTYIEQEQGQEPGKRELEGKAIAARIRQLTGDRGIYIFDSEEKEYRKCQYRDIVILLRTMAGWSEDLAEVLSAEGIPAYTDTRSGYFQTMEVRNVLSLLKIIDNPRQDIPLTAVLHCAIGDFSLEELAYIRSENQEAELWDACIQYSTTGGREELREKMAGFLSRLSAYRDMAAFTEIHKLLMYVMEDTGYYHYVSVMPGGKRRKANLDMLVEKAVEFQATSYHGLFHFNRYIERLYKYEIDYGEAGASGEGNGVCIMSIHKSKGLEFPVVFLAGMGKVFNNQDSRSSMLIHPDLGLGPDYVDCIRRTKTPTLIKKVIQNQLVLENLAEELRVLYVAFTRAKEKLILTGTIKDFYKTMEKWEEEREQQRGKLTFYKLVSAKSYLDWVGPALSRPNQLPTDIRYIGAQQLMEQELVRQIEGHGEKQELLFWNREKVWDMKWRDEFQQAFSFAYPYQWEAGLPGKLSVTELKKLSGQAGRGLKEELSEGTFLVGEEDSALEEAPLPEFMGKEKEGRPAYRGTVYHKIMECLDFSVLKKKNGWKEELNRLVEERCITKEEEGFIREQDLIRFADSPLCRRMADSMEKGKLYREQKFVIGIPAEELSIPAWNPEEESQEQKDNLILIQGIIDAYFEEEDGLVLVDYKTDQVFHKDGESKLLRRYKTQFDYYSMALERLTHKKVKERLLYSFALGKAVRV